MRIGILTGGGDCPGLNAVVRAAVRKAERHYGDTIIGFRNGWLGLMENDYEELNIERMRGTLPRGGTVLGTSRVEPFKVEGGSKATAATLKKHKIDVLIVVGGDGTLSVAVDFQEETGFPIIGVPKTIDNDISETDFTFGFMTAVQTATDAIDRLHTTAESHDRIMVVEVMGRNSGHIAVWAGIAGGATLTLMPEEPFDINKICDALKVRHSTNRFASIIVVAEGATPIEGTMKLPKPVKDEFGHFQLAGIGDLVTKEIEAQTGLTCRSLSLSYLQRGGTPSAFDRVICTSFGVEAVEAIHQSDFGKMISYQKGRIQRVELVKSKVKPVDPELIEIAKTFFLPGLDK